MMLGQMRGLLTVVGLLTASVAQAECTVAADPGAVARDVSPTVPGSADLVIAATLAPKLLHVDYQTAAKRPTCDLGSLTTGRGGYELWGGESPSRQRKALPSSIGEPIALVIPVVDIRKAIDSSQTGKATPTEGYLLAVVTETDVTGWRFYTGMPDLPALRHDMADALASTGTPIFRNTGNQANIFVHPNQPAG